MTKLLVISGASRGIGKATAATFHKQGWDVVNLSRHVCDLRYVKNIQVDFSDPRGISSKQTDLLTAIQGAAQITLVHNAAMYVTDNVRDLDSVSLRKVLEINIVAPTILNNLLIPIMPTNSAIIYIGSTLAEKAVTNVASYCTSKHALAGLMKATCQDLASSGIHTCCICPGFTDTEMLHEHLQHDAAILEAVKQRSAARRFVQPEEIAQTIYFAATNPVINGAMIHANLGQIEN